jgi:hypothetical protein
MAPPRDPAQHVVQTLFPPTGHRYAFLLVVSALDGDPYTTVAVLPSLVVGARSDVLGAWLGLAPGEEPVTWRSRFLESVFVSASEAKRWLEIGKRAELAALDARTRSIRFPTGGVFGGVAIGDATATGAPAPLRAKEWTAKPGERFDVIDVELSGGLAMFTYRGHRCTALQEKVTVDP